MKPNSVPFKDCVWFVCKVPKFFKILKINFIYNIETVSYTHLDVYKRQTL